MTIINFTPWTALLGGFCIGISAFMLLVLHGRVAGISGIISGLMTKRMHEIAWRLIFLAGLVLGSYLGLNLHLAPTNLTISSNLFILIFAGLCVGFGAVLGGGCTSGHGVCGLSRLSLRSIVATVIFMIVAFIVVYVMRHIIG